MCKPWLGAAIVVFSLAAGCQEDSARSVGAEAPAIGVEASAAGARAVPADWITVDRPDLGLTASFPAQPVVETQERDSAAGRIHATTFTAVSGERSFLLVVASLPDSMALLPATELAALTLNGQAASFGAQAPRTSSATLGGVEGVGARFDGSHEGAPVTLVGRASAGGGHVVFATSIAPRGQVDEAATARFFDGIRQPGGATPLHERLWKEFSPGGGRFRVELPGTPATNEYPVPGDGGFLARRYGLDLKSAQFEVTEYRLASGGEIPDAEERAETVARASLSSAGARDLKEEAVTVPGARGREFRATAGDGGSTHYIAVRSLGGDGASYLLQVRSRVPLDPVVYRRFFKSFRIVGATP